MPQDRPKTAPRGSCELSFCDIVLASDFGPLLVPFWFHFAPFWTPKTTPKSIQKSIKNRLAARCPPRLPQEPPKTPPPDSPGPPKTLPKRPPRASRPLLGPSKKSKTSKSSKTCRKKVDRGRLQWSLNTIARKNRKSVHNSRTPEGGGGGRAKRSSIRNSLLHCQA